MPKQQWNVLSALTLSKGTVLACKEKQAFGAKTALSPANLALPFAHLPPQFSG
jgi:hypothetical protein